MAIRSWRVADTEGVGESAFVRPTDLWRVGVGFGLVGFFSVIGFFGFTSSFLCYPPRIRSVMGRLGRLWEAVKDRIEDVVVALVLLTEAKFSNRRCGGEERRQQTGKHNSHGDPRQAEQPVISAYSPSGK